MQIEHRIQSVGSGHTEKEEFILMCWGRGSDLDLTSTKLSLGWLMVERLRGLAGRSPGFGSQCPHGDPVPGDPTPSPVVYVHGIPAMLLHMCR